MVDEAERGKQQGKIFNLAVKREFLMWLLTRIFGVVLVSTMVAVFVLLFGTVDCGTDRTVNRKNERSRKLE